MSLPQRTASVAFRVLVLPATLAVLCSPMPATAQDADASPSVIIAPFADEVTGNVGFGRIVVQEAAVGGRLEGNGVQILSQDDIEESLARMGRRLPSTDVNCVVARQLAHLFRDVAAVVCGSVRKVGDAAVEIRPMIWSEPWLSEAALEPIVAHDAQEAAFALRAALESWFDGG